ncbi:hypothetical protein BYT27DRAFT_7249459 [Phlegmacium glaucopus]|nr:hypothetical protein BYT27DRAFT_7249459 [Phlegmacium glaucopus]
MSSPDTLEANTNYSGLTNILTSLSTGDYSDVLADIEGEQETVPDLAPEDFKPQECSADSSRLPSQWEEAISSVSKGVTDMTHREYIRLSEAAISFFISKKLISKCEQFFLKNPQENADKLIVAWIMNE